MPFYNSEECFRRYEKVIAQALGSYPETVRFTSPKRSAQTDAARCNDAIAAYRKNRWSSVYPVLAELDDKPIGAWTEGAKDKAVTVLGPKSSEVININIVTGPGDGVHGAVKVVPTNADQVRQLINMVNEAVLQIPLEFDNQWKVLIEGEIAGLMNVAIRAEPNTVILF